MKRISQDEIQQALTEHTEAIKPSHADTSTQNDWTKCASGTTALRLNLAEARAAAQARIAEQFAANAAKPTAPKPTPEQVHQELVARRRDGNNAQFFNRNSFAAKQN